MDQEIISKTIYSNRTDPNDGGVENKQNGLNN